MIAAVLNKNDICDITIDDLGEFGEGIGRVDGFAVFVPGALPGEQVSAKIVKVKKNYGYGKLIDILAPSADRVAPVCSVFERCGGCSLQHLSYTAQLAHKQRKITAQLKHIGGFEADVPPVLGMTDPFGYRNKGQFPVAAKNGQTVCGFYQRRSHDVVPITRCAIQHPSATHALRLTRQFLVENDIKPYDEMNHSGFVRHVLIRTGFTTGEILVCLVINGHTLPHTEKLIRTLAPLKGLASICLNINTRKGNVILGETTKIIWGKSAITDFIGPLQFQISAASFFQVNPVQTKVLYELCVEMAALEPSDVVFDAYCGIGTIALFMARHARNVYGVEIVPQAIADAKQNAALNHLYNTEFFIGDAADILPSWLDKQRVMPNMVVLDPPRAGCDVRLLHALCRTKPDKILYVSCNPATLARDLKELCAGSVYHVEAVRGVDCFPMTTHVETIVLLQRQV